MERQPLPGALNVALPLRSLLASMMKESPLSRLQLAARMSELNRYHQRPHAGLDEETPFQRAASYKGEIKRIGNERALDILLSPPVDGKTRSLGKKGLEINGGFYSHAELWRNHTTGDAFRVALDETDLGRVYVYDEDGFVCVAICPQRLGMAPEEIRKHAMECKRMANEQRKQGVTQMRKAKESVNLNEQINGFLQAKAADAGKLTPFPQSSTLHNTAALDGAAKAADEVDNPPRSPEAEKLTAEARAHFAAQQPTAEIIQFQAKAIHPLDRMDDAELYAYWDELDAGIKAGGELPDDARIRLFYADAPQSSLFKAQATMRR